MPATTRPLIALTADDLMSRDVLQVSETMPLREAARLLLQHQVSGAPVVELGGTCVGVLSTTDLLRWSHQQKSDSPAKDAPLPLSCLYQSKQRAPNGEVWTRCTLPPDVCPIQRKEKGSDGKERIYCSQPNCVLSDWQMVEVEQLPAENVGEFMTPDPVLVAQDTPVTDLARKMVDAHIHRVIVVDRQRRPIGIVSSTDILAQVARMNPDPLIEPEDLF